MQKNADNFQVSQTEHELPQCLARSLEAKTNYYKYQTEPLLPDCVAQTQRETITNIRQTQDIGPHDFSHNSARNKVCASRPDTR